MGDEKLNHGIHGIIGTGFGVDLVPVSIDVLAVVFE
jgi:hypothetical protein